MKMLAVMFATLSAMAVAAAPNAVCLECHEEKQAPFQVSVHSVLGCADCHADIRGYPHPEKVAAVNCAACHAAEPAAVAASVHAGASKQACATCHGDAHAVLAAKDPKSPVYPLNLPRTCGACHGDPKFAQQHGLKNVYAAYVDSIHGFALTRDGLLVAATCSSCHGAHDVRSSKDPQSRTSRAHVPDTCGTCHAGIKADYMSGIHGKAMQDGDARAPVCTSCHTAHNIAGVRNVSWQTQTTATCGNCHQDKFGTYHDTFHAQVSALGYVETARCWDCHGEHKILSELDPKSPVSPVNLVQTCGKCHTGANAGFVSYQPHADARNAQAYPLLHASAIFMNLLLASVLGFFALHTVLWFIRSYGERRKP